MSKFAVIGSYSESSIAGLVQSPSDRSVAAREVIESLGGKLESFYWMLGEDDFIGIFDAPDDVTAAAVSVKVTSAGACRNVRTIRLLTMDETQKLLQKAKSATYHPPSAIPAGRG
ncbi:MAG TPA: GYD domain-containing protein [Candidatus Dormibacteraeota bacterium]|nr:GYD domain-containing protein [Candidatus Dormibacteraeota bacterium]